MFRLQTLTVLQEVDLRLNPVIQNESDYRLFVVHMLPNLRRLGKVAPCVVYQIRGMSPKRYLDLRTSAQ